MAGLASIRKRFWRAFRGARDSYMDLGRFQRLRVIIVAVLIADVAVTGLLVFAMSRGPSDLTVSYKVEFPTRLLILRNRSSALTNAQVTLDGTYRYTLPRLETGAVGIELRDFRDADGIPPDASYSPRRAEIRSPQARYELAVRTDAP